MMATSPAVPPRSSERASSPRLQVSVEAAFRTALTESFDRLDLCDRNMLRFHYVRGLHADQLARLFCSHPTAVVRQLTRLRERLLRDTRRGLAVRLELDRDELDRLIDVARERFDLALARILRA